MRGSGRSAVGMSESLSGQSGASCDDSSKGPSPLRGGPSRQSDPGGRAATAQSSKPRRKNAGRPYTAAAMSHQEADEILKRMEARNAELELEYRIGGKEIERANDLSTQFELQKKEDDADWYSEQIEKEKRAVALLEEQIKIVSGKVEEQNKSVGGWAATKHNNKLIGKKIRAEENKLDELTRTYNHLLREIHVQKEKIADLRHERAVYDKVYANIERKVYVKLGEREKLQKELREAESQLEAVTATFEQLQHIAEEEDAQYKRDINELHELMERERKQGEKRIERERTRGQNRKRRKPKENENVARMKMYDELLARLRDEAGVMSWDDYGRKFHMQASRIDELVQ